MLTWLLTTTKTQQRQRCFGLILNLLYDEDDYDNVEDDKDEVDDDIDELSYVRV